MKTHATDCAISKWFIDLKSDDPTTACNCGFVKSSDSKESKLEIAVEALSYAKTLLEPLDYELSSRLASGRVNAKNSVDKINKALEKIGALPPDPRDELLKKASKLITRSVSESIHTDWNNNQRDWLKRYEELTTNGDR